MGGNKGRWRKGCAGGISPEGHCDSGSWGQLGTALEGGQTGGAGRALSSSPAPARSSHGMESATRSTLAETGARR